MSLFEVSSIVSEPCRSMVTRVSGIRSTIRCGLTFGASLWHTSRSIIARRMSNFGQYSRKCFSSSMECKQKSQNLFGIKLKENLCLLRALRPIRNLQWLILPFPWPYTYNGFVLDSEVSLRAFTNCVGVGVFLTYSGRLFQSLIVFGKKDWW